MADPSRGHILRNTALVAAMFALAAAAGVLRNIVIAGTFGIGANLDAYYAAFKLPDLLFTVVAGGALATAFIPVFAGFLANGDREGAWRLASAITNLVEIAVAVLAALAAVAAPWLVRAVLAPGFDPAQQAETVTLMRLVLLSTLLFGISAVQGSVLHGFKHFFLPALAAVLYPLGIAAGALWLAPAWGVRGLAAGAIVGAALHLAVKVPGLVRHGFRWQPVLDLGSPAVRRVLVLMGPRILDLGVFHLSVLAATNLASRLGPGSVSALEWGWDAMQLPETVIGTAFGLVAFPTLSELAARGDLPGLRRTLGDTLGAIIALTVPAAVGLLVLGRPLLAVLYQRGAFDAAATEAVFVALQFYAVGLVGHACLEVAARTFFARQDTVTPLVVAAGSAAASVGLGLLLMGPLGHGGLALANSLAVSAEVLVLLAILHRRLRGVDAPRLVRALLSATAASVPMAAVVVLAGRAGGEAGLPGLVTLAVSAGAGLVAYLAAGVLLGARPLASIRAAMGE